MLTAIRVPAATADTRVGFAEFARRHGDYAMVGLAATAKTSGKGLRDVRLAFFGVGSTPLRARGGSRIGGRRRRGAGCGARSLEPPDDMQATGAVKKHLAGVLLRRVAAQLTEAGDDEHVSTFPSQSTAKR